MEEKTKLIQVAGILYVPGIDIVYYLLSPRPVEKDTWMDDNTNMFYVALEHGVKSYHIARHVVVKGSFLIDYKRAGEMINILVQEEYAEEIDYLGIPDALTDRMSELLETAETGR